MLVIVAAHPLRCTGTAVGHHREACGNRRNVTRTADLQHGITAGGAHFVHARTAHHGRPADAQTGVQGRIEFGIVHHITQRRQFFFRCAQPRHAQAAALRDVNGGDWRHFAEAGPDPEPFQDQTAAV